MNNATYINIISEFQQLNFNEQLDLITDLIKTIKNNQNYSAEMRAEIRLKDEFNPNKWITTIDENDEIDEEELNNWVKNQGAKIIKND